MAPSWSQNGIKIDAKIYYFLDAFGNRFLVEFWWILRGKWKQNGTKIGAKIDLGAKAEKSTKRQPASAKLGSEGPSWEQKPIKNRSKFEVQDGVPLGIDF